MSKKLKVAQVLAIAVIALAFVMSATSARADGDSYVIQQGSPTVVFAKTVYTSAETATTTGVDSALYGTVQFQVSVDVTSTQVTTVTPQFTNAPGPCFSAGGWIDAEEQLVYAASNITPTYGSVLLRYTLTGDDADNREIKSLGRCFRLSIVSAGQRYTPTAYIRLLKRN